MVSLLGSAKAVSARARVSTLSATACAAFLTTKLSTDAACSVHETVILLALEDGSTRDDVELLLRLVSTDDETLPFAEWVLVVDVSAILVDFIDDELPITEETGDDNDSDDALAAAPTDVIAELDEEKFE